MLFVAPDEAGKPPLRQLNEQVVLLLKCTKTFAQVQLPFEEGIQGWVRKEDLSIFSPFYVGFGQKMQYVVRLMGGCCAGKSSFEKALLRKKGNWEVIDEDDVGFVVLKEALHKRFPDELSLISRCIEDRNLFHAFLRKQVCFKKETTTEERDKILEFLSKIREELDNPSHLDWKKSLWRSVGEKVVVDVQTAVSHKKHVLVSAWGSAMSKVGSEFPSLKNVKVLLYNPLRVAFDRLIERNEAAMRTDNYEPRRLPSFVPVSYCKLMKLTQEKSLACDSVTRRELEATFDRIIGSLECPRPEEIPESFTDYDFPEKYLRERQGELFSPLGESQDLCYIAPQDTYDIILRSDKATPEELVHSLLGALSLRE